jgi:hypothetical protein
MASPPSTKAMASTSSAQVSEESDTAGAAASPEKSEGTGVAGGDGGGGGGAGGGVRSTSSRVSGHSLAIFIREEVDPGAVVGYFHSICQDHGE